MSTQCLDASLFGNSLRDEEEDIRGEKTDGDGLDARMFKDLFENTHDGGAVCSLHTRAGRLLVLMLSKQ